MTALSVILNSLWISAALALVAWAIGRWALRGDAATRHLLWWAVLALLILLPIAGGRSSAVPRAVGPAAVAAMDDAAPLPAAPIPSAAPRRSLFPLRIPAGPWMGLLAAVWLALFLLQFTRMVWSFRYLRTLKRRSVPAASALQTAFDRWVAEFRITRPVQLLVSDAVASPLAMGFFHPAVILPAPLLEHLGERELDHVFLHELAHIARRDDWSNLIAQAFGAVAALHPVAAWVLRQVERERELACDEWVVARTGEARPYAASLARLFEVCGRLRRMALAAGMAGTGSHLGERIELLLGRGRHFTAKASPIQVGIAATLMLGVVVACARSPRWIVVAPRQTAARAMVHPAVFVNRGPVGTRGSFLAALVAAGYGDLPVDDIISLKEHGIDGVYLAGLAASGWGRLSAANMIELRVHAVSPSFLAQVRAAGFHEVSVDDVIAMHEQGVQPAAFAQIHALGFGPFTPGEAIELKTHGVSPRFFQSLALRGAGRLNFNVEQIIRLKDSGVIR